MYNEFLKWVLGVATSTGIIAFVVYLTRETLMRFFTRSVEHQFEKKLESFKADIRDSEKELEQIRSFLVSARRDRDQALQAKRFEAAESMMHARKALAEFSMLVEYMKNLKTDAILKSGDDPKIIEFINIIIKPINIDEKLKSYGLFDKTLFSLYLGEETIKTFEAYEMIMVNAATMMKIFSMPLSGKEKIINKSNMGKVVIEAAPLSKNGFEKFGDEHAYHWSGYFYAEILKALRKELHGADNMEKDTESATRLALDSRNAQLTIRKTLDTIGLSDTLLNPVVNQGEGGV
ncbi:hypothetical protein J8631_24775 [Serratia fonticola]|uniref:hypothetical protein n=1 Tax=Serratia fonticola TaxID=47917 RepID=UPI001AE6C4D0|nr:hypothetical protein [Serratia fonticola]MBP1038797.1 hypothetical protein [Serratia fonticola]CAI1132899.1 Uncharacterised protein [Serratia fonticola]